MMAAGLNVISSNKMIRGVVCITKTGEGVKYLSKYISKEIICVCDSIFVSRMLNIYAHSKVFLLPYKFSSDNSKHINIASKLLIQEGYTPTDLYAFIFVSGGGSGLRLNTIHINYLSTLAEKC